jgi:hypothetical protein
MVMDQKSDTRRHKRHIVKGIQGNVFHASDLEVLNISIDGAAIETRKRLELNKEYTFRIKYKDAFLKLKGCVVWAVLVSKEKSDSKSIIPIYRAGIRFTETLTEKASMLLDFIKENKIKTLENRSAGIRFKIGNAKNIKVDYPHGYSVKKMSMSGMLVEAECPLDIDSHYNIEMFLDGRMINTVGRIANCEKLGYGDLSKYAIGIEFIDMTGEDRKFLKDFFNALSVNR